MPVLDGAAQLPAPPDYELVEPRLDGVHVETGRAVAEALMAEAGRIGAAVMVVGSRGRAALPEILLGSVAMATMHHATRPVMVVRHGPQAASARTTARQA